eukprot:CAMPEP_0119146896 /NCGR_PEP_ID=MMETSP1310-20130426/39599_1 /TAXON_ID=464262 /ORGANISM="Genus nov. species nov., Strain RCC2339" /LENGTH=56 /DNA_ID=CAMNT_0007138819 /DNA_START=259 /DNA_END=426 /DNA_ORIENTATION=+
MVLPDYEFRTLFHHLMYHRLLGVDEIVVYFDERQPPQQITTPEIRMLIQSMVERIP